MPKSLFTLLYLTVSAALLSACASTAPNTAPSPPAYPAQYRLALDEFPGTAEVSTQVIDRFVAFLANLGADSTGAVATELYAADLHFSDALMVTRDKQTVVDHFTRLGNAGTTVDVDIHQTLRQGPDVYLIWSMQARFTPVRREVVSDTLGVTHVRFNPQGQVILHQDFWDSGLGFYSHIPVLGAGVRAVGRRFAAEE